MLPDKILIIEDDPEMLAVLRQGLEQDGMAVEVSGDGRAGLEAAREASYEVIVLDVMLPEIDGFAVARELRSQHDHTPILMLTARDSVSDIVHGFDCGADDYLTKPFSFLELSARVRSLVRRNAPTRSLLQVGDLALNEATREVWRGKREVRLTKTEFELLAVLMRSNGDTVRRQELVRKVWGANTSVGENTLDASISALRGRIERPGLPRLLYTVRGFGYRLKAPE